MKPHGLSFTIFNTGERCKVSVPI